MIYLIYGPTSSGKSSLALNLASELNGSIISADSRQIYKYMDIGTGQLSIKHLSEIKYNTEIQARFDISKDSLIFEPSEHIRGIDVYLTKIISPNIIYSVSDFQRHAFKLMHYLESKNITPIIVGGTGLYTDSLFSDHDYGNEIKVPNLNEIKFITPDIPREKVYENIDLRVEQMFDLGLVSEVETLIKYGYKDCRSLSGAGYKQVLNYLGNRGKTLERDFPEYLEKPIPPNPPILDLETCIEKVKIAYRNYAKRQYTWFRKYENASKYDIMSYGNT